jgi:benzoyl-CoA reductase/2-hydroxyglutaryl-CoA dehydratase subunit BcrC/BadD/HgdB
MKSIVKDLRINKNSNMKLKYNIIALVFISLFAVSCGKKKLQKKKLRKNRTRKNRLMKKLHKLLLHLRKNK